MVAAVVGAVAVVGGAVASSRSASKGAKAQTDAARAAGNTELAMYDQNREDLAPYRNTGYLALNELSRGLGLRSPGGSSAAPTQALSFTDWLQQNGGLSGTGAVTIGGRGVTNTPGGGQAQQQQQMDAQRANYQHYVDNFNAETAASQVPDGTTGIGDFNRDFTLADFEKDPGYEFRMGEGRNALESSASMRGGLLSGATLKALNRYGQDFASNEYSNAYARFNNDRTQRFNRLSAVAGTGQTATNTTATLGANTANNIANLQTQTGNVNAARAVAQGNAINNATSSLGSYYLQRQYSGGSVPSATLGPYGD